MSSPSTTGRPFTGRLRSSSRPGIAEQSKNVSISFVPSTTKTQDGSNDPNCSTRPSMYRTSSTCVAGHEVGENVSASSRGVGCRSGAASLSQPDSTTERAATLGPADEAEATKMTSGVKHSNNGDGGARGPSLTDGGIDPWNAVANAPEDKRAARRRRRAEAAAAAAAAALESEKTNDTGLSRGAASHPSLAAGTGRIHSRRSSTRGHSGVEWKRRRQPSESNTEESRPSALSASLTSCESSGERTQPTEPECSSLRRAPANHSEAGVGSHKNQKSEDSVQPKASAEVVSPLARRTSSQNAEGSGAEDQEGPKTANLVSVSFEADTMCDAVPGGSTPVSERAAPLDTGDRVNRVPGNGSDILAACRSDSPMPTVSSVARSSVAVQPAIGSERGGSGDNLLLCSTDRTSFLESPPCDKTLFHSATEGPAARTGPHACLTETGEQAESNEASASSTEILHANLRTEASGNTRIGTLRSSTDPCTTTSCSEGAEQAEYSPGVCSGDVGHLGTSGGPLHALETTDHNSLLGRARESQAVNPVAPKCSLEGERRQDAQGGSSGEDMARRDNDETGSMPWLAFGCSTIPEGLEQVTTVGDTFSAAGGASVRDTTRLAALEGAASLHTKTGVHLTPVLHGLECLRGELMLNREEFEALQSLLRPVFYRLVPCASPNECISAFHDRVNRVHYTCGGIGHQASVGCSPVPLHKEGKPSSRRLAQELHALQQAACAFAALPSRGSKRRREPQLKGFHDDEAEFGSAAYSSSHSSGGSFCSIGTHRRDHEGAGEDGEGSKGHDTPPVQEAGRRRQQSRARKLPLRLDEDIEDEEGVADVLRGYRRNQQMRLSGSEVVERATSANSDDEELSAVSGPTPRRVRGTSSKSWKRTQSVDDACGRPSIVGKEQPLHGERQMRRGSTIREGRGGKGTYTEVEAYASAASTRGLGVRRMDSKGHRRRHLPKESDCDAFGRLVHNEYSGNAEETEAHLHGSRRLWGAKQKKRRGGTASLGTRGGQNSIDNRYSVESYGSTTDSCSSPLFQVSPTIGWRESCFQILQHLKRQPAARWFLSQDCDAPHGYADSSVQRLSLQDIEQKLTSCILPRCTGEAVPMSKKTLGGAPTTFCESGYVHPSQWQQEVRQIFFHAFTYHPVYHEIWRDAAILAAEFERCCRLAHQVNPYYPSMLKRQRYSSGAIVHGTARHSAERDCAPGVSGASTATAVNNRPQLPVPCMVYGGSPFDFSTRTPEAHSSVGRNQFIPGPVVTQHLHQTIPLIHSQQVHFSQSAPSNFCPHSTFLASGAPGAAMVGGGAFGEGSTALGYAPGTPYLRGGCGKKHGNSRSSRIWGDGGVRGKRQQLHQHEAGVPEGRVGTEDVGVIRKADGSLAYAYGGQYREVSPGDEGGKSSRIMATAAVGSPRRGGRGGGRGRGIVRCGRGSVLGNELRGSAPLQQQVCSQHQWSSIGGHASQGPGVVSEHQFFGTVAELQQQPFAASGRMLPVGAAAVGQHASDGGLMLMGRAGLSAVTGFAGAPTVPGTGGPANVLLLGSSNVLETVQQMDAPVGAPVLLPPPVPRIGVNDKPLSSSQRRTLEQNMQRLSPLQRKAALELIQDDLGILAAEYMNVKAFAFDTELLSIEKQKRLFAYVNSMFRANREILLSQHQEQVAAAQASAMSAAADGAAEALQQPSGVRRGRRKKGEESVEGGRGGVQSRSGSSSSSSGSDSDSSSSLSSSDTSSSSSSSDTEEEESEESENEGDYCQEASASTCDASSTAAQSASVSGVDTGNGTGAGSGRTGTVTAPQDTGSDVHGREHFSEKTPASGTWDLRGGCGGEVECDRWNEERHTTSEVGSRRGHEVVGGIVREKDDVNESPGMVALEGAADGLETTVLASTARQIADYPASETAAGDRLGSSSRKSPPDRSSPEKCVNRRISRSEDVGPSSGDSCGLALMPDQHADSPVDSSAGSSASRVPVSAFSHSVSTRRPDSSGACPTGGDEAEIRELHKNGAADGEQMTGNCVGSYGASVALKTSGSSGRTLPQYTPVCEEGARVEIRAEVMGRHADFLGVLAVREAGASENEVGVVNGTSSRVRLRKGTRMGDCTTKPTAWQEWKGQVIQQGFVAQRAYASQQQRSVSEIIAERYNARI